MRRILSLAIATAFATLPLESAAAGEPPPAGLSAAEKTAYDGMAALYTKGAGFARIMLTRPQTLGYSLADSPVDLAACLYDKFADWTDSGGRPERALTKDEMLDDITLYWLTNTVTLAARLYWENNNINNINNNFNAVDISLPTAITVFPGEIYRAPGSWAERACHNLVYFNEAEEGGHIAAWEQPDIFAREIRAAFRSLG
jgi:pimeloyl-ACP methyl ester carboxylesterase